MKTKSKQKRHKNESQGIPACMKCNSCRSDEEAVGGGVDVVDLRVGERPIVAVHGRDRARKHLASGNAPADVAEARPRVVLRNTYMYI